MVGDSPYGATSRQDLNSRSHRRGDGVADQIAAVAGPISISFAPSINRFRGQENVELQLLDWHGS